MKHYIAISEQGLKFNSEPLTKYDLKADTFVMYEGALCRIVALGGVGDDVSVFVKSDRDDEHRAHIRAISLVKTLEKDNLITLVKKMREHQRNFFASKPNTPERQEHLALSKQYERQVDALINSLTDQPQLSL